MIKAAAIKRSGFQPGYTNVLLHTELYLARSATSRLVQVVPSTRLIFTILLKIPFTYGIHDRARTLECIVITLIFAYP